MKVYRGVEVLFHSYLTPAVVSGEWSVSSSGPFTLLLLLLLLLLLTAIGLSPGGSSPTAVQTKIKIHKTTKRLQNIKKHKTTK
jgi:hypothetical protein